jgi:DNA-binding response OmpR family regulator
VWGDVEDHAVRARGDGSATGDRRVLIVDDEPRFGRFVRTVAAQAGFAVDVATDGAAFKAAFERTEPTHIVLDLVMPGMSGGDLVAWLVERRSTARLVIVTGLHTDDALDARRAAESGGLGPVRVLAKPVSVGDLRAALIAGAP